MDGINFAIVVGDVELVVRKAIDDALMRAPSYAIRIMSSCKFCAELRGATYQSKLLVHSVFALLNQLRDSPNLPLPTVFSYVATPMGDSSISFLIKSNCSCATETLNFAGIFLVPSGRVS